jgi:hypothetical protein
MPRSVPAESRTRDLLAVAGALEPLLRRHIQATSRIPHLLPA